MRADGAGAQIVSSAEELAMDHMDHKERFFATIARAPVDRPAVWMGIPDPAAHAGLCRYFSVADMRQLAVRLDDDVWPVELPYHSPTADAIYAAFDFAKQGKIDREHRTLNAPGFFEGFTDPERVEEFAWPNPTDYIDREACRAVVREAPGGAAVLGVIWSAHFQDACAAFGMENAFVTLYEAPEMFRAVIDRIVDFYLRANEVFYEETRGQLDAVLIGNDFGAQHGLLLSPAMIRKYALPGTRALVAQAKEYGIRVIHHSCGAVRDIIPDLISAGVDVIHPIQALATGMEPRGLRDDFGDRVAFCGGVDAQSLLVRGTPGQVREAVRELASIFPTGLIVSPSHEAILPDTPPANVEAMFSAVREVADAD